MSETPKLDHLHQGKENQLLQHMEYYKLVDMTITRSWRYNVQITFMLQESLPYRSVYTPLSFLSSMFWTLHKSYSDVPVPTSAYTDDSTSTYIYHTLHSIHSHIWAHSRPQSKASGFDTKRSCKYIHGQSNIHYTSQLFFLALIYFMANQLGLVSQ